MGNVHRSPISSKDGGEHLRCRLWLWNFIAVVVRWVKHYRACGEKVEVFGAVVVKGVNVGYCVDF